MERTNAHPVAVGRILTTPRDTPPPTPAVEKFALGIGNVIAIALAVLLAITAAMFLLFTLQPILTILLVLIVFPVAIPLLAFVVIWFDVNDSPMGWRKP